MAGSYLRLIVGGKARRDRFPDTKTGLKEARSAAQRIADRAKKNVSIQRVRARRAAQKSDVSLKSLVKNLGAKLVEHPSEKRALLWIPQEKALQWFSKLRGEWRPKGLRVVAAERCAAGRCGERPRARMKSGTPGTVGNFLLVLSSKLTQYDQRETTKELKRGRSNIYRLGHLLGALHKVEGDVQGLEGRSDAEALDALKASMNTRFTEGFAPVRQVERQIDRWLEKGKPPSLKETKGGNAPSVRSRTIPKQIRDRANMYGIPVQLRQFSDGSRHYIVAGMAASSTSAALHLIKRFAKNPPVEGELRWPSTGQVIDTAGPSVEDFG